MIIEQHKHRYDTDIQDMYIKNYINLHTPYQHHYMLIIVWQMVDYHNQIYLTV